LKLASTFAKYLYQHKVLNLPGIGVFSIDPSLPVPEPSDKSVHDFVQQIHFVQKPVAKPDEAFIDFIRTQTGKIRPLAESDLESYLADGKILLNIGKPFYFEGIGSLHKNRQGTYDFIPGEPLIDRLEVVKEDRTATEGEHRTSQQIARAHNEDLRKVFIGLAVILGLAAIIWGGYLIYNKSRRSAAATVPDTTAQADTTNSILSKPDSAAAKKDTANFLTASATPTYKFIIETTFNKNRALRRYEQLKSYMLDVRMDATPDSSMFKIYFQFPAQPADTNHIKDSLVKFYNARKVVIEQQ
jgi:hypothetical protein